ncbi:hypothetical protein BCR39DRAFT_268517 [Naematelia encephala]|uniref:Chromo domain-containing protein n=1 Tax=Naematelia encephala TaxID=71784 RepID=A0A1Y2BG61_9TREE|nr:hypothetical protein BCR39DRAFT_268517 [Naematelia encephala]
MSGTSSYSTRETSHGVSSDDTLLQNRLEQMISISRLSSGVESLPTSCRSSVSPPPFTQHVLPTVRRSLRTPTKSIDYVHHPMDSAKRRAQKNANLARIQSSASAKSASTRSGGISERDLRGVSVHSREISTLLPSDGARTGAKWPRQGANTVKGRMEEIACDMCHGRVHWACAGLEDRDSLKNEPWACPDCRVISSRYNNSEDEDEDHTYIEVERAQQERCLRPNCVWRSRRRIVRKQQDEDTFYIEAILGRRATGRRIYSTNKRVWEYLVKWHDWELWDATWEPAQHIPDLEYYQSHFVQAAKKADVDISRKVVLLPGVLEWYDEDGDRLDKKLTEMGIEPRTWWQDK